MKTLKSILLTLLLVVGLHATTQAQKSLSQEDRFPVNTAAKLEITGISGFDIEIQSSDSKEVYFSWEIIGSEDDVNEIAKESGVEFTENGSIARMNFVLNGGKSESKNINDQSWIKSILTAKKNEPMFSSNSKSVKHILKIVYPKSFTLSMDARYSSISGYDFENDISIQNRAGNLELENVKGNLTVVNNYGNIDLRNISGNVSVEARSGNMRFDDVDGNVSFSADYGKMRLRNVSGNVNSTIRSGTVQIENIGGNVTHNGNYTNVTLKTVKGSVEMDNRSGSLTAEYIGGLNFSGDYAKVDVRNSTSDALFVVNGRNITANFYEISASVKFVGQYSKFTSNKSIGRFDVEIEKGSLDLTEHKGNVFFSSSYSEFRAVELSADSVNVTIEKAKTFIEFSSKPVYVNIKAEYGNSDLRFDDGFDGTVYLESNLGNIQNDLKLNSVTSKNTEGRSLMEGVSGAGKGSLRVVTEKGDIRIR